MLGKKKGKKQRMGPELCVRANTVYVLWLYDVRIEIKIGFKQGNNWDLCG
jgi:hypothetical protein